MAKPLKINGLSELRALTTRVGRQFGRRRISREDHDFIKVRLDEVEARIIAMREEEDDGDPN